MLFSVVAEIEDRERFLQDMAELGQLRNYESRIKGEIAELIRELRNIGEKLTGKRDNSSFAHLTGAIASKTASQVGTSTHSSVGGGSDSVAALFAPQSPTSISLLSSPERKGGKRSKRIEQYDPHALPLAPSNEFDLMSGKAIKDLESAFAASAMFGGAAALSKQLQASARRSAMPSMSSSTSSGAESNEPNPPLSASSSVRLPPIRSARNPNK
jgi:hypothetical protein